MEKGVDHLMGRYEPWPFPLVGWTNNRHDRRQRPETKVHPPEKPAA